MPTDLTIGIPTAGRAPALARCIRSIRANVSVPYRIVVFDSMPGPETAALCAGQPDVVHRTVSGPVGPAGSRRAIVQFDDRPVLLFLDDDIIVRPGAVEALLDHLERHPGTDIAGGGWEESGSLSSRALAQWFVEGDTPAGRAVAKRFMTIAEARDLGLRSVRADGVTATMAVRRRVWDSVGFDARYGFFYDMFDLFLQCRAAGIVIDAIPASVFIHAPVPYSSPTTRQATPRAEDQQRFVEKWGLHPVGRLGMGQTHRRATIPEAPETPTRAAPGGVTARVGRLLRMWDR